jgi:hypothetical protein
MPNRVTSHPGEGYVMRHTRGVVDDWYRIEPEDGEEGWWVSATGETYVEVKR